MSRPATPPHPGAPPASAASMDLSGDAVLSLSSLQKTQELEVEVEVARASEDLVQVSATGGLEIVVERGAVVEAPVPLPPPGATLDVVMAPEDSALRLHLTRPPTSEPAPGVEPRVPSEAQAWRALRAGAWSEAEELYRRVEEQLEREHASGVRGAAVALPEVSAARSLCLLMGCPELVERQRRAWKILEAAEAAPDSTRLLELAARAQLASGRQEAALGLYRRLAELEPGNSEWTTHLRLIQGSAQREAAPAREQVPRDQARMLEVAVVAAGAALLLVSVLAALDSGAGQGSPPGALTWIRAAVFGAVGALLARRARAWSPAAVPVGGRALAEGALAGLVLGQLLPAPAPESTAQGVLLAGFASAVGEELLLRKGLAASMLGRWPGAPWAAALGALPAGAWCAWSMGGGARGALVWALGQAWLTALYAESRSVAAPLVARLVVAATMAALTLR